VISIGSLARIFGMNHYKKWSLRKLK
jgi:hypothetical protein